MGEPIKLPPLPPDILVGESQLAILWKISSYARLAVEQATADLRADCEALRAERNHSRECLERASVLIHGIHALLYPPHVTLSDGRTMAFRPSSLDPHEVLQQLSDRIRALPDELAAPKEPT